MFVDQLVLIYLDLFSELINQVPEWKYKHEQAPSPGHILNQKLSPRPLQVSSGRPKSPNMTHQSLTLFYHGPETSSLSRPLQGKPGRSRSPYRTHQSLTPFFRVDQEYSKTHVFLKREKSSKTQKFKKPLEIYQN